MEEFGQRLKELRIEKGLSAKAFAEIIEVSDMTVGRWECNKTDITGENLKKVAEYFGVTTDYLLGLED